MTFLDFARQGRLRHGLRGLSAGAPVIEAQLDAGFDSASGFRDAFARLFGHPPAAMARGAAGLIIINNVAGELRGSLGQSVTLPVLSLYEAGRAAGIPAEWLIPAP